MKVLRRGRKHNRAMMAGLRAGGYTRDITVDFRKWLLGVSFYSDNAGWMAFLYVGPVQFSLWRDQ